MTYELIVNGLGSIYCGRDELVAITEYIIFKKRSLSRQGQAAGRSVILMGDARPIQQHLVCAACLGPVERAVACCGAHWCIGHLRTHDAECDAEYGHSAYRVMVPETMVTLARRVI